AFRRDVDISVLRFVARDHLSAEVFSERRFGQQFRNSAAKSAHGRPITSGTGPIPLLHKTRERFPVFIPYISQRGRASVILCFGEAAIIGGCFLETLGVESALPIDQ